MPGVSRNDSDKKPSESPLAPDVEARLIAFLRSGINGSITLHVANGKVRSLDVRYVENMARG